MFPNEHQYHKSVSTSISVGSNPGERILVKAVTWKVGIFHIPSISTFIIIYLSPGAN